MTWSGFWWWVSFVLGALCVVVPARAAVLLFRRRAPLLVPLVLAALAAGMFPLAASDKLEKIAERMTGWMLLPQLVYFEVVGACSGCVAWFVVERFAEVRDAGGRWERLGLTEGRWKAVIVVWTSAMMAAIFLFYWLGGVYLRDSPSSGHAHDDASFWMAVSFAACVIPTHAGVAWIGWAWRDDEELRPLPRHLFVYGLSGVVAPTLLILVRLDLWWMRWPDDLADAVMWAITLAGLHAFGEYALISHKRAQSVVEEVGAGSN